MMTKRLVKRSKMTMTMIMVVLEMTATIDDDDHSIKPLNKHNLLTYFK